MAEIKKKINQLIQTIDQEALEIFFKSMKTQLNFVVREWAEKLNI